MVNGYLEAVLFTEEINPSSDFCPLARARAWNDCSRFLIANGDLIAGRTSMAGHDLWLTRNGHGTGFWDRPELWGEDGANILTRCAECMGGIDVYIDDDESVCFDWS
jgi:hypothetical protein